MTTEEKRLKDIYLDRLAAGDNPITLTEQKFQDAAEGKIELRLWCSECPLCLAVENCDDCVIVVRSHKNWRCDDYKVFRDVTYLMRKPYIDGHRVVPGSRLAKYIISAVIPALRKLKKWADKEKFYE